MKKIKSIIFIFLFFNLFFQILDWSDSYDIYNDLKKGSEYVKKRVVVDSLIKSRDVLTESGKDRLIYTVFFKNPKGKLIIEDNTYSIYKAKKVKSNILQFSEYYQKHQDSINIWYHPVLKNKYILDGQENFKDSLIWSYIILRLSFLLIAILTLIVVVFKIKKRKYDK
ncbi:hypothetical protein [Aquimarina agarilytica]|uniref:hypothetical protein n=1 Tax=Aquimarina agarilytica TaxID=1087449 RepID=UPI000289CAD4|nr:hypothetical protein [Aquimarina agarilytica]